MHRDLKWIVSFPLVRPDTRESLGVLNIDGLVDVPDPTMISEISGSVQDKVDQVARNLSLQPLTCVSMDAMGVMHDA